jgi:hypothetical protein
MGNMDERDDQGMRIYLREIGRVNLLLPPRKSSWRGGSRRGT